MPYDVTKPDVARAYDYLHGGKDNFARSPSRPENACGAPDLVYAKMANFDFEQPEKLRSKR